MGLNNPGITRVLENKFIYLYSYSDLAVRINDANHFIYS